MENLLLAALWPSLPMAAPFQETQQTHCETLSKNHKSDTAQSAHEPD
jgi:hypothetical protein